MRSLYNNMPDIPWDKINYIGFDMDGTLYDEFDFIYQVYEPIAALFSDQKSSVEKENILNHMLLRWLEKGSSYPFIFSEVADTLKIEREVQEKIIKQALSIFRNFKPKLNLSERMDFMLKQLGKNNKLFLVTDGSSTLQWNKIHALGLQEYFSVENIFISGDHGKGMEKPGLESLKYLGFFKSEIQPEEVVFIGDRQMDKNYAKNAGFFYMHINTALNQENKWLR